MSDAASDLQARIGMAWDMAQEIIDAKRRVGLTGMLRLRRCVKLDRHTVEAISLWAADLIVPEDEFELHVEVVVSD